MASRDRPHMTSLPGHQDKVVVLGRGGCASLDYLHFQPPPCNTILDVTRRQGIRIIRVEDSVVLALSIGLVGLESDL